MKDPIYLNDLLQLDDLKNVKLRFNLHFADKKVPAIKYYNDEEIGVMLYGQYHNYSKKGNFKEGNISLGFVPNWCSFSKMSLSASSSNSICIPA